MRIGPCCLTLLAGVILSSVLCAQESSPYRPKLANSKDGAIHDFPMGVMSATGRLANGDRAILVVDVGQGGAAARGGLMVGDRIVSMDGRQPAAYSNKTDTGLAGPQTDLAIAIERACANKPHQLQLTVLRNEKKLPLKILVPASRGFAASFPDRCPKRERYLTAIADHLAATQRKDGSWKPGVGGDADVYMSAFCALSLLAADKQAHRPDMVLAIGLFQLRALRRSSRPTQRSVPRIGRRRRPRFFSPNTNSQPATTHTSLT
jgi:hypothetical protein